MTESQDNRPLGKLELIAIALGGMIGGGIFSILGISTSMIGHATPIAIALGGGLAFLAAYSYAKLASYYKDQGATYSFFKKTYPNNKYAIVCIGWLISFGYISTLALYAYTFSSYFCSLFPTISESSFHKVVSGLIILLFTIINAKSVEGMGRIEDILVYTKVFILLVISSFFLHKGEVADFSSFHTEDHSFFSILTVSAITFVAYEGFQLVINAYDEVRDPDRNVPFSIYTAILLTSFLYIVLSIGALSIIPIETIIKDQEYALAAGASSVLGHSGYLLVMTGALLATSSAISGTLFGASRLVAVIATDGGFPSFLSKRDRRIPTRALWIMAIMSYIFILTGGLRIILEFGSITFIIVSFIMALANYKLREKTNTKGWIAMLSMVLLAAASVIILYYEVKTDTKQMGYIIGVYIILLVLAKLNTKNLKI